MLFESVACDWLSLRHEYAEEVEPRNGGRVMRLDADGVIEWEQVCWESVRCASSDTSIRVKCDGRRLYASGNIGRFQRQDNVLGFTVLQCVERWAEVLKGLGFSLAGFGTRDRIGTPAECGTYLTRIDLAGNMRVSDYPALCSAALVRRIGQKLPQPGRYGPTWGYEAKRSNWWKAKLYDKAAEQAGERRPRSGETDARFEVQLGMEWLKREGMDSVMAWRDDDMGKVIYGRFAEPLFREALAVQDWTALPVKLRHWATEWREGRDIRSQLSVSGYYKVRKQLLAYGIDIGTPCNVTALTRHVRVVEVMPLPALLEAA